MGGVPFRSCGRRQLGRTVGRRGRQLEEFSQSLAIPPWPHKQERGAQRGAQVGRPVFLSLGAFMELNQLETFLAVAEERSFSRAAVRLRRTQPAVSQVIRKLEEAVGETLFDRAARDGSLTPAGVLLRDYAQRLLALRREATSALDELKSLERGHLQLAANEYTCMYLLPAIDAFRREFPHIGRHRAAHAGLAHSRGTQPAYLRAGRHQLPARPRAVSAPSPSMATAWLSSSARAIPWPRRGGCQLRTWAARTLSPTMCPRHCGAR